MKILFTGGQGFIGTHVSQRLKKVGHDVRFFDSDVLNSSQLFKKLSEIPFDYVIHLAGISSVPQGESDLEKLFAINQFGTSLLLEGIKGHCPSAHLIFSSSAQVYDSNQQMPLSEEAKVLPLNAYARSKYTSEQLIRAYSDCYQMPATVFRIFNHTHKTHHPEFFLPGIYDRCSKAKDQGLNAQEILVGNLELVRDISPVQRIVDIFEKYVSSNHEKKTYNVFNICSGYGSSLKTLAHELGNQMGIDISFKADSSRFRKNDPTNFIGNNQKIISYLSMSKNTEMSEKYIIKKFLENI